MNHLPVLLVLALPMAANAGEVYGALTQAGQALANEPISVVCSDGATAPRAAASTDGFGAYRLAIGGEGRCHISVRGAAGVEVHVYRSPQRYNFELKTVAGRPQLTQR